MLLKLVPEPEGRPEGAPGPSGHVSIPFLPSLPCPMDTAEFT